MKHPLYLFGIILCLVFSCQESRQEKELTLTYTPQSTLLKTYTIDTVKELTDEQYPNNPDIAIRSKLDGTFSHQTIDIFQNGINDFNFTIYPSNSNSDTILLNNIKLLEWIPSTPKTIKKDGYLAHIAIVNQEWNRMQVNFTPDQFIIKGNNQEGKTITRVDLARNCINAYLWELIFYTEEDGKRKPCYHGWFNFPKELYANLFEEKNELTFAKYQSSLENWIDPASKPINLNLLRSVTTSKVVRFKNLNNELYPIKGERKKKAINIIHPKKQLNINAFLTDSTIYATFSSPGFYNQLEPRKTQLHRLNKLQSVNVNTIKSNISSDTNLLELQLTFKNNIDTTQLIIGGLNRDNIPTLNISSINEGYQMPMGIANHSFYTNYKDIIANPSDKNPYYGFLLDQNNNWLDSHTIGIDGPLLHFDKTNPNLLHLWILSFERHSFVGHYVINLG